LAVVPDDLDGVLWHAPRTLVPRFRLRYQDSDLELPAAGSFVIGRSSACNLALDDALVSRRHASIEVRDGGAFVEDLGSRNGVLVNGVRVEGSRKLAHLDRITIGAHDLVVVLVGEEGAVRCDACGTLGVPVQGRCGRCGAPSSRHNHATLVGSHALGAGALAETRVGDEDESTIVGSLLAGIADKALAMGRFDEAERVLARVLSAQLARAQRGDPVSPARLSESTSYAIRLAEGTKKASWIDWIFEIHYATGSLLSAPDVERLHEIVRKVRYTSSGVLRRYVEKLAARTDLTPAQRFQVQRLQGLLRVVSA
jgi:hypothetical protein